MARRLQAPTTLFFMLIFGAATAVSAQVVGGAIHGTVRDAQGAVLPGAAVVVRNVATGVIHEQASDHTGHYQVLALAPGDTEVNVTLTGFRSIAHRGIRLTVGQTAVIDSALELGVVSELIEVRGDAVSVNLATGSVSGLVGEREIRDLPLNG